MAIFPLRRGQLFEAVLTSGGEVVTELVIRGAARIERIVSLGQGSPEGFWYNQEEDEFVVLLSGAAELEFEGGDSVKLLPGEWIDIPAHVRHRVKWTARDQPTVWLAVFQRGSVG